MTTLFSIVHPEEITDLQAIQISPGTGRYRTTTELTITHI